MWKRRELKANARKSLKANYWCLIGVCFLLAFLVGNHETSMSGINLYNDAYEAEIPVVQEIQKSDLDYSMAKILPPVLFHGADSEKLEKVEKITSTAMSSLSGDEGPFYKFIYGYVKLFVDRDYSAGVIFLISGLIGILYHFFVKNLLVIGECRVFMETRTYTKTRFFRLFFLYRQRKVLNPAIVMFFRDLFLFLWMFTIAGLFIKYYSYRMVPYIIAENPQVSYKQAIALSRKLMNGNKWQAFLLDVSYLWWIILSMFTFGLLGIFFANPYITATDTELYMVLRRQAITDKVENYEILNDDLLENPPADII